MRSKSPRAVWGLGAGRVKWCSGVGEGASFEKACSRLRQSMFFTSHVCQRFFQGAAAAAAGRGSPPPPGAGVGATVVIRVQEHDGKEQEEQGGWASHDFQPPPPPGPLLRYLSSEMGGPGPGGLGGLGGGLLARSRGFCAMSLGALRAVATLTAFWHAIGRKRGPGGDFSGRVCEFRVLDRDTLRRFCVFGHAR